MRSAILIELESENVVFCGERKTGEPGEKPLEQGENQQQSQLTYGNGPESKARATLVEFAFLSRLEGSRSRVEGKWSRVECNGVQLIQIKI